MAAARPVELTQQPALEVQLPVHSSSACVIPLAAAADDDVLGKPAADSVPEAPQPQKPGSSSRGCSPPPGLHTLPESVRAGASQTPAPKEGAFKGVVVCAPQLGQQQQLQQEKQQQQQQPFVEAVLRLKVAKTLEPGEICDSSRRLRLPRRLWRQTSLLRLEGSGSSSSRSDGEEGLALSPRARQSRQILTAGEQCSLLARHLVVLRWSRHRHLTIPAASGLQRLWWCKNSRCHMVDHTLV